MTGDVGADKKYGAQGEILVGDVSCKFGDRYAEKMHRNRNAIVGLSFKIC